MLAVFRPAMRIQAQVICSHVCCSLHLHPLQVLARDVPPRAVKREAVEIGPAPSQAAFELRCPRNGQQA